MDAHESGELTSALKDGEAGFGKWLKALGKEQGRKGKRLFMPTRVALTGSMHVSLPHTLPRSCLDLVSSSLVNLSSCLAKSISSARGHYRASL